MHDVTKFSKLSMLKIKYFIIFNKLEL